MKLYRTRRTIEDPAAGVEPVEVDEARSFVPPTIPWAMTIPTKAGVPVTIDTALRSAAVTACVRVLKSTIAGLPVDSVRYQGKRRVVVEPTPSIVRRPGSHVRRRAWVAQLVHGLLTDGNSYGLVVAFDRLGLPAAVDTVAPNRVRWDGHRPSVDGAEATPIGDARAGTFLHIPAAPFLRPGCVVADSPVELAREAIGVGLAAEEFGGRFFDQPHPTAIIRSSTELNRDQADAIKANVLASWQNRSPAVMGSGLEVDMVEVKPTDSQFIDLMRFEVEQVCRFLGVPPSMVYASLSGQNITYQNVTDSDLHYLKHSVAIWVADLEDAWSELLPAGQHVRFRVEALLRMDPLRRHQLYETRLRNRTLTVNEVRALEDEDPFGVEFDEPGVPGGAPDPAPAIDPPTPTEE